MADEALKHKFEENYLPKGVRMPQEAKEGLYKALAYYYNGHPEIGKRLRHANDISGAVGSGTYNGACIEWLASADRKSSAG